MFRAKCFYTFGCGLKIGNLVADSFAELQEKVATVMESSFKIEKIIYNYPSGRTFTKVF